jgi:type III pantothenate kinase
MLLAIDIGNSETVVGFFDGQDLVHQWRMTSKSPRTADEFHLLVLSLLRESQVDRSRVQRVAVASVVPSLTPEFVAMSERLFGVTPLVIDGRVDTGVPLNVDDPTSVGADRIVNLVGAKARHGAPAIVVDLGTATTFDALDAGGVYQGGAIAPGVGISAEALFQRGARLARVELKPPPRAIGKTTEEHLQAGIVFGQVGQIDEIVKRIAAEMGGKPKVVATGGLAPVLAPHSCTIDVIDPDLTLHGIRLVEERLSGGGGV